MAEPWFDPVRFGTYYGVIVGGGGGSLIGMMGGVIGYCASKGKARRAVLGSMYFIVLLGLAQLAFGGYAWSQGQPYAIWYPPLLSGIVFTAVIGGLIPVIAARYREADGRRLEAAAIRGA